MAKGFSLIELIVAVAIIGIVSAIAVPAYRSYIEVGRAQECSEEIAAIALAEETFAARSLTYFSGADVLALENASGLIYQRSSRFINGTANCTIAVSAGPSGIATQYKISATGANLLKGKGKGPLDIIVEQQNY